MEWTKSLQQAISYMEAHLLEDISPEDVAEEVYISSFYLQKGFKIMTGYSMGEYIRCRRLYLAALDAISGNDKVIELSYKYGYETPESFTRAFSRFHGISPAQIRSHAEKIRTFLPLKIKVIVQGGNEMDYAVEKMSGFQVIGFQKEFSFESSYLEIPRFWGEYSTKYMNPLCAGKNPDSDVERVICDCNIGEFGICLDDTGKEKTFRYLIAGRYSGGEVPEGMTVVAFPDMDWAKFRCIGAMPGSLQSVNTRIFQEWLPKNKEYEIAMEANIEWYSKGDISASDYESAIWIPVKKK
ncbi:AraC family transcriptional regulator [Blautia schinkii]|nr:AraC family transcriptional regulator [Blautia schinkii]